MQMRIYRNRVETIKSPRGVAMGVSSFYMGASLPRAHKNRGEIALSPIGINRNQFAVLVSLQMTSS